MSSDDVTLAAKATAKALNQWPLLVVVAVVGVGFAVTWVNWPTGFLIMAAAMALAAILRLVLTDRLAGLLRVRSRGFDVAFSMLAAVSIAILTLSRMG